MHERTTRRTRGVSAKLSCFAIGLLLAATAACGSSSSSNGSGSSDAKANLASAEKALKPYEGVPTFTAPGPNVDAAKASGKKIAVVAINLQAAQLVNLNAGIKAAAAVAGLDVSFFDAQSNISSVQQGISQAISQKVSAVILNGVPTQLIPKSLDALKAANIPLIAATVGQSVKDPNIYGLSSADYTEMGKVMANSALVATQGAPVKAGVVKFTNPSVPDGLAGIESVFKSCSGCEILKQITVEPANWATQVSPSSTTLIRSNPSMNIVFAAVDDTLGLFATQGVAAATGSKVKVVAAQGSGAGPLALVQKGPTFAADPGQSAPWTGWGAVDQALRAMTGMPAGKDVTPIRYLDQKTLKGVNIKDDTALYGDSYIAGFKKLWGLS